MLLTSCGPVLNPYNEDFKCRARDDAEECIDTPTAYKKARYPETETTKKNRAPKWRKTRNAGQPVRRACSITAGGEKTITATTKNPPGTSAPLQR